MRHQPKYNKKAARGSPYIGCLKISRTPATGNSLVTTALSTAKIEQVSGKFSDGIQKKKHPTSKKNAQIALELLRYEEMEVLCR